MEIAWWAERARGGEPGRPAAFAVWTLRKVVLPFVRLLHRARLDGVEHLPSGAYMLVGNHSAGLGTAELLCLAALWVDQVGADRPIVGFAHPLAFHVWPVSQLLRSVGAVPSTYDAGRATLASGFPLLVFPGGDHETFRPIWQAHTVDFGGHAGFLRLARQADVPVVPLGIRGGHFTAPVLLRSRLLARLLVIPPLFGVKKWALTLFGVGVAAAIWWLVPIAPVWRMAAIWIWLCTPFIFFTYVPATIRLRVGRPIPVAELYPSPETAPSEALERVQREVQWIVDELGRD